MAQQTLTVSAVSVPGSTPFAISFAGLGSQEFATEQEFRAWALEVVTDQTTVRKLLACWYLGLDPTLANPSILLNATLTYNDIVGGVTIQVGG